MPEQRLETFAYPPGIDHGIVRFCSTAYQVADTTLTFDGKLLRQLDANAALLAMIDTTKPFRWSSWIDRRTYVVEVRQNDQLLVFTSIIEHATRIDADILRINALKNRGL